MLNLLQKGSIEKRHSYQIFDQIAKSYDFLNHFLSFGIDIYWRKKLLSYLPSQGDLLVLDLATGTGDLALTLANHRRVKKILGLDLSEEMIKIGRTKVQQKNLTEKIELVIGDGVNIPLPDQSYDVITMAFGIRNFSDPQLSLLNMKRVLKVGGRVLIIEFALPSAKLWRKTYLFYFRKLLPRIGNILSGHPQAYTYLNHSVESFPYGDDFLKLMAEAGFSNLKYHSLTFGVANIYIGERRG